VTRGSAGRVGGVGLVDQVVDQLDHRLDQVLGRVAVGVAWGGGGPDGARPLVVTLSHVSDGTQTC